MRKWITVSFLVVLVLGSAGYILFSPVKTPDQDQKNQRKQHAGHDGNSEEKQIWQCPMHPNFTQPEPGNCDICGMELVPKKEGAQFSAAERKQASIRTVPVRRKYVETEIPLLGKVEIDETRKQTITAWVDGRIERLYNDHPGMQISRDEKMVELYSPELRVTHNDLLDARKRKKNASAARAKKEAARQIKNIRNRLREWGLRKEQIQELYEADQVHERITIPAPMDGTIMDVHKNDGEWIKKGDPIFSLVDLSRVWVILEAYEKDLAHLRYGQKVTLETEAYPGKTYEGRIHFIKPFMHDTHRTVHMHIHAENPDRKLMPGMFADTTVQARLSAGGEVVYPKSGPQYICPVHPEETASEPGQCPRGGRKLKPVEEKGYVTKDEAQPPLVIPETAPLLTGERAVVYVEQPAPDDGSLKSYNLREIVLGPKAGRYYIVKDGLEEGERVVYQGAFKIDSQLQLQGEPSMMYPEAGEQSGSGDHNH